MIGFTPQQANAMTFWEFSCAANGWMRAHGAKPRVAAPSDAEFEAAVARH